MASEEQQAKEKLFENVPISRAVAILSVPTVLSSLVMVLYSRRTPILSACSMIRFRRRR